MIIDHSIFQQRCQPDYQGRGKPLFGLNSSILSQTMKHQKFNFVEEGVSLADN